MKDKCRNCANPSKACVAYLMTISTKETLEWCRMWKNRFGWSNADLAEKSDVPNGTINRIFSHSKIEDDAAGVKLATIRPIICALTGCTLEELEACESSENLAAVHADDRAKIDYLKERVDYLKNQIKFKEDQMSTKDKLIAEQQDSLKRKDRTIALLALLLGIAVLVIIAFLVVDVLNPDKGFFWLADLFTDTNNDIFKNIF